MTCDGFPANLAGPRNTVSPEFVGKRPARIFAIRRRLRTERDFDYFL